MSDARAVPTALPARIREWWEFSRYVVREALPDELASVAVTIMLTVGSWVALWQLLRFGQPLAVPSSTFQTVLWAVVCPVWARLVWRGTQRNVVVREDFAACERDQQVGRHHAPEPTTERITTAWAKESSTSPVTTPSTTAAPFAAPESWPPASSAPRQPTT